MPTVPTLVERASKRFGQRTAVVSGQRSLTFAEVGRRSAKLANALQSFNNHHDGTVAILMSNRLEYMETDFGIARAGMIKVPINTKLGDEESRHILEASEAEVLITESAEVARALDFQRSLPSLRTVLCLDGTPRGTVDYEEVISAASDQMEPWPQDPRRTSQLLFTSGTTGRPKGAMLTDQARVFATMMMVAEEYRPSSTDGMLHVGPLSHGTGSKMLAYFSRGARNVIMNRFDPQSFFSDATSVGGTSTFLVPTMIQMLLDHTPQDARFRGALGNITYGGAPISRRLLTHAIDRFGPVFTQVYGSCEALHPVTVLRHRGFDDSLAAGEGNVPAGYPVLGVDIRIRPAQREPMGRNPLVGELQVRGPNVMSQYWSDPVATAEVLQDGWYKTGDVASLGSDGLLTIVGRQRDLIITGGLNVYPSEVERALSSNPMIAEVCIVGVPDQKWGELVAAVIVPRDGATITERSLGEWLEGRLGGYKKPRIVRCVRELPKGPTGKVLRSSVQKLLRGTADPARIRVDG